MYIFSTHLRNFPKQILASNFQSQTQKTQKIEKITKT